MKSLFFMFCTLAFGPLACFGAESVEGVLLAKSCLADGAVADYQAAMDLSKTCNLAKQGKKKGFVIVQEDGKSFQLDSKGAGLALQTIRITGREAEVRVRAEGKVKGERLSVEQLAFI